MNFSEALKLMIEGKSVKRKGWNGKNLYVRSYKSNICGNMFIIVNVGIAPMQINSWVPSVSDLYAEDWELFL